MKCVLCRSLIRFGTEIGVDFRFYRTDVLPKLQSWRYARANDKEVYQQDPELDAVQKAEQLAENDPELALLQLRALAERGSVWSMLLAGWAYQTGKGVAADQAQAEHWYRLAFEGGCQQAQLRLGRIYTTRQEFDRCEEVYGVGASDHWAPAMYYLAWTKLRQPKTPDSSKQARILLEQAAAQGDLGAQIDLAQLMLRGRFGLHLIPLGLWLAFDVAKKTVALADKNTPVTD